MVDQESFRASGKTTGEEVIEEQAKDANKPMALDPQKPILTPRFHRMKTNWNGPDADVIARAKIGINKQLRRDFSDAYDIMFELYLVVRNPVVDEDTGEVRYAPDGMPEWERTPTGGFVEDWSKLNVRQRERFLYMITTRMFEWEQTAADVWGEAVFAKAGWELSKAEGFELLVGEKHTIQARDARATHASAEDRYIGVYKAWYSKKADALISSMERISQRLKDIHTS